MRRKPDKQIIKAMEADGFKYMGTVPDFTTLEGQELETKLDREVVEVNGMIHNVRYGRKCMVFSGPNPEGSRFRHKLPQSKEAA